MEIVVIILFALIFGLLAYYSFKIIGRIDIAVNWALFSLALLAIIPAFLYVEEFFIITGCISLCLYVFNLIMCYRLGEEVDIAGGKWLALAFFFHFVIFIILFIWYINENFDQIEEKLRKEIKIIQKGFTSLKSIKISKQLPANTIPKQIKPKQIQSPEKNPVTQLNLLSPEDIEIGLPMIEELEICGKCNGVGINLDTGKLCTCKNGFLIPGNKIIIKKS
ncbi:MAG: hypothetical protein K8S16_08415 [Bacteroidales bacterium]|nr:hypothetical protein [Bacteroidales bacterium]